MNEMNEWINEWMNQWMNEWIKYLYFTALNYMTVLYKFAIL